MGNVPVVGGMAEMYYELEDFVGEVTDGIVKSANIVGDFIEDLGGKLADDLQRLGEFIFKNTIGAAEEAGKKYYYALIEEAESKAYEIMRNAEAAVEEANQLYEQAKDGIVETALETTSKIENGVTDFYEDAVELTGEYVEDIQEFGEDMQELAEESVEAISDFAETAIDELEAAAKSVSGMIQEIFDYMLEMDWGFDDILSIFDFISDLMGDIFGSGMKSNKKTGKEREYEDHEKTPGYEENLIDEDGNYAFKPVEKMENISNKTREKFGNLYLKLVDKNIKKSGKMCHSQNEKIVKCLKISSYLIMFLIILLIIKKKKLN